VSPDVRDAPGAEVDAYDVGGVVPVEGFDALEPGTSLLVCGPAMVSKQQLVLELLARGVEVGQHAVVVTPDTSAGRLRSSFDRVTGTTDRLWIVDCSASGGGSFDDTRQVKQVSSPGDLTGIGIGIAKCTRGIGQEVDDGLRLSLLSVSTLLQYASVDRVFNFLHVLTGRVAAGDYLGIATLDPTTHDRTTVNTVRSQFDGVIELRETGDDREVRVKGVTDVDHAWTAF